MRVPIAQKSISDKEIREAKKALDELVWTEGHYSEEFSELIKLAVDRKYCQLVNSGSSANFIALASCKLAFEWEDGDEVITCALGFPTTVAPIIQLGLKPVFVDAKGLNINADLIEQKISKRTKAIMIAHTLGFPFDFKQIKRLCNKYGLKLVEDTCDAIGSRVGGTVCGGIGDVSTFSFYPAHCLTTIEGGAVVTNNIKIFAIARSLTNWGRACYCKPGQDNTCGHRFDYQLGKLPKGWDHKYTYLYAGWNLKMNDIEAAIGTVQIKKLDNFVQIRRSNYIEYSNRIIYDCEPLPDGVNPFGFVMYCDNAIEMNKKLFEAGVGARLLMGGNLLRQPFLRGYGDPDEFKGADKTANSVVWIGVQPNLSMQEKEDAIFIINNI